MNRPHLRRLTTRSLATAALATGALAGIAVGSEGAAASGATGVSDKPTIVLEHGAWADASSWTGVVSRLQADGYTVDAPPDPLRGLASDSAFLVSYLKSVKGPIVLVGHSYGGAVITNAATGDAQVKALVYVDAFAPAQGETVQQLVGSQPGSCLGGGGDPSKVFSFSQDPGLRSGDFDLALKWAPDPPYPGFGPCFANDLTTQHAHVLQATQRPLAADAIAEPSGPPAWKTIRSWYLLGTKDQVIPPAEQAFMAERAGAHIRRIPASHLAMVSHPEAVTDLIVEAAGDR